MVPKSKRQRLLVKFPISDSIPTSKLRNPRTTKKTSKVPETVLKKNLCSLYFILLQNLCCKNVDWLVVSNILLFSSLFGKDSHFDEYFSNGLVQPPTSGPLGYTELLLQKVKHDFYLPANNPCRMTDLRASINRDLSQNQFFIPNNFQTASPATVCFF